MFKKGDVLECVKSLNGWTTKGKEYTVIVDSLGPSKHNLVRVVADNGKNRWFWNSRFVLATPKEKEVITPWWQEPIGDTK